MRTAEYFGLKVKMGRNVRKRAGYLGTTLCRDVNESDRYLTIDRWESKQAYDELRRLHHEEYQAIDKRCEGLTESEELIGTFESQGH